jgi:methylated-DNA-protein-cysteine methyltransferase-like protein
MRKKPKLFGDRIREDRWEPREAHLKILDAIRQIPRGCVCTYGRVAEAAGWPRRARLVGQILRHSPLSDGVPWHRVVNASGRISARDGEGPRRQRERLAAEGVRVDFRGRVDLAVNLWSYNEKRKTRKGRARHGRRSVVLRDIPNAVSSSGLKRGRLARRSGRASA